MLKKTIVVIFLCILISNSTLADEKGFGLGVILGEPTGISFKLWRARNIAYSGAVAWSTENKNDVLHIHADVLMHMYNFIEVEQGKVPIYFGIGGRTKFEDDNRFGARFPFGLSYEVEKYPLDIFFEIVPVFDIFPNTELNINGGIGIRYFFY
jgi:hypothetical protein